MRRTTALLLLAGAAVIVAAVTGPGKAASVAAGPKTVLFHVPLPAPQQAGITQATVTVTGANGPVHLRALNDGQFGNSSAVALIGAAKKGSTVTYTIDVLIRRFLSQRLANAAADQGVGLAFTYYGAQYQLSPEHGLHSCYAIESWDKLFESGQRTVIHNGEAISLVSLRPQSVQSSPPEEVLDNVIALAWPANSCPGQPEGDDAGDT